MKKQITTFVCLGSFTAVSQGQLVFSEGFDYPAGGLAGNTNDGNNWVHNTGDAVKNEVVATSVVPVTPANLSALGGSVSQTASGRVSLELDAAVAPGTDNTTLYISFVQQLDDDTGTKSQILEFWRGTATANNTVFSFGTDTNGAAPDYGLLVDKGAVSAVGFETKTASTEPRLVVIRIDFGPGDADNISVYVDPGITEPVTSDGSTAYANLSFNRLGFGSFQGGGQNVDEIRIGATYGDVVPISDDMEPDGMPDDWELANGLLVGTNDSTFDEDNNGGPDGLNNLQEYLAGTDPQDADTDDDNLLDGEEASVTGNVNPYTGDTLGSAPGDTTDPLKKDSDDDGINDDEEVFAGDDGFITNPNNADTDNDNLPDKFEIDGGLDPTDATGVNGEFGNNDSDELDNDQELALGTNPSLADTDDDGFDDHVETNDGFFNSLMETGTDPLVPDTDGDGLKDGEEGFDDGGTPEGPLYNSDPNEFDTDGDSFNDKLEVDNGTDPDDSTDFPVFPPVVTSVQFDFDGGEGSREYAGVYNVATPATPAHQEGFLSDVQNVFNNIAEDTMTTLVNVEGGAELSLGVDLGTAQGAPGGPYTFDLNDTLESTGIPGAENNANIYDTALMEDWLFTRNDKNWLVRVNGLAAGTYRTIAILRESSEPNRTYSVYFGTQAADSSTDPVFGAAEVGIAGAPATWVANQNFYTQDVTIEDNEYIVVMVDPTNSTFSSMEGLQIFPAPVAPAEIEVTGVSFTDATTFEINFTGAADTAHSIGSSVTLDGGFTPINGVTATTDAQGLGTFTLTVDTGVDPKNFYQITQP